MKYLHLKPGESIGRLLTKAPDGVLLDLFQLRQNCFDIKAFGVVGITVREFDAAGFVNDVDRGYGQGVMIMSRGLHQVDPVSFIFFDCGIIHLEPEAKLFCGCKIGVREQGKRNLEFFDIAFCIFDAVGADGDYFRTVPGDFRLGLDEFLEMPGTD